MRAMTPTGIVTIAAVIGGFLWMWLLLERLRRDLSNQLSGLRRDISGLLSDLTNQISDVRSDLSTKIGKMSE